MNKDYKCPCCGGAISFDSSLQKLKCPYCETEFDVEVFASYDEHLKQDAEDSAQWEDTTEEWNEEGVIEYSCESCGGSILCDEHTAATSCPYCGNPVVVMGKVSGSLKPDIIIPFKLDKKKAKEMYEKHLKKKLLLPSVFKAENKIDEIKGIYVPFWLFDSDTDSHIRCRGTKTRHWSDSRYDYTEYRYYSIIRGGTMNFTRVPVDGSSAIPDDLTESVEPYDVKDETEFATAYFAGYMADKYDVDADTSKKRACERIKSSAVSALQDTIHGYTSVSLESSNVQFYNNSYRYAMYPVWLMNTTWQGKKFMFAMNGQTGKFVGNLPTDWKKFWLYFFLFAFGIAAVIFGTALLVTAL